MLKHRFRIVRPTYVYVQDKNGEPLMPTCRHGHVRRLLEEGKAVVAKRTPFTIKLLGREGGYTQFITLGVDAGSKTAGLSATTEAREYISAEMLLRTDVVGNISTKRECRRARRNRKTRHRKPRFDNRRKGEGWLPPSVKQKIHSHGKLIDLVCGILPVGRIVIETAAFDAQKLKDDAISGHDYQNGGQKGFHNVREYVLHRDGHTCQHCGGKSGDNVLNAHHLESRRTGGDAPSNLITLCGTCHDAYHKGRIELKQKRGQPFRDAAFMNSVRWAFYGEMKERHPDVRMTYGYLTKISRIEAGLPKSHTIDARCISGNPLAQPAGETFLFKCVRTRNRQTHRMTILKGGVRKLNQAPKYVFGYQLFDEVRLDDGRHGFVFGRRLKGAFDIRSLNGQRVKEITHKKLTLSKRRSSVLAERAAYGSAEQRKGHSGKTG
jgi:N6-L-threonylcarbamoyladenine synthase